MALTREERVRAQVNSNVEGEEWVKVVRVIEIVNYLTWWVRKKGNLLIISFLKIKTSFIYF